MKTFFPFYGRGVRAKLHRYRWNHYIIKPFAGGAGCRCYWVSPRLARIERKGEATDRSRGPTHGLPTKPKRVAQLRLAERRQLSRRRGRKC